MTGNTIPKGLRTPECLASGKDAIAVNELLVERCCERSRPAFFGQAEFARAYDSVRHTGSHECMKSRGVPPPVIGACMRDMRSTRMVLKHSLWATDEVAPRIGLRQGYSRSPLVFRWVVDQEPS